MRGSSAGVYGTSGSQPQLRPLPLRVGLVGPPECARRAESCGCAATVGGCYSSTSASDLCVRFNVDPRHSIARDQFPLRVRPKSARDCSQLGRDGDGDPSSGRAWSRFTSAVTPPAMGSPASAPRGSDIDGRKPDPLGISDHGPPAIGGKPHSTPTPTSACDTDRLAEASDDYSRPGRHASIR